MTDCSVLIDLEAALNGLYEIWGISFNNIEGYTIEVEYQFYYTEDVMLTSNISSLNFIYYVNGEEITSTYRQVVNSYILEPDSNEFNGRILLCGED